MSSQQLEDHGGTQYDRLVAVMADLRARGAKILADAQSAQAVSRGLGAGIDSASAEE